MAKPKAPTASVKQLRADPRKALQRKLNTEHPEFFHTFDRVGSTPAARSAADKEVVYCDTYEDGAEHIPLSLKRDIVVRIPIDKWVAGNQERNQESVDQVKSIIAKSSDAVMGSSGQVGTINDGEKPDNSVGMLKPHAGEIVIPEAKPKVGRPPKSKTIE